MKDEEKRDALRAIAGVRPDPVMCPCLATWGRIFVLTSSLLQHSSFLTTSTSPSNDTTYSQHAIFY